MELKSKYGDNVISMFGDKPECRFPEIKQIEAYWESLRMGRMVPTRAEVDPRGMEHALEYAFILERIAPGLARVRLNGMHLNDLLGMEVRGMPFTSFFTPKARREVTDVLEKVFDGPQTAELTLAGERSIGKPALEAKIILLPLRSDLGEVSRIVGALVSKGEIGRAPRRFDIETIKMKVLTPGHRPLVPADPKPTKTSEFRFSEPAVPFATAGDDAPSKSQPKARHEKGPDAKHPALRLIDTED